MKILAIETSCDETAAAVIADGRHILANTVASQVDLHACYGGVVPEVASRQHVLTAAPTVEQALVDAGLSWGGLDGIAVTRGPGLSGALLVGLNTAKALAFAHDLPLIGVNHLEGHIYANWLIDPQGPPEQPEPEFPLLCLIVSGGHTDLVLMSDHGRYTRLGRTRDDAAGEAFDKVARIVGLGYPGGPAIQRAAEGGDSNAYPLPRAWLKGSDDFSFSGLKTAVSRVVDGFGGQATPAQVRDLAASFQWAVVEVLAAKTVAAARAHDVRQVLIAGGVAANGPLRERIKADSPVPVRYPRLAFCTDNAAMIGAAGYYRLRTGQRHGFDLDVDTNLKLVS